MAPRRYSLGKRAQAVEDTRRRIVDATFDLHNEKGVLNTSMQDVAERADVAPRTIQEATALTDFYVWKAFNQRDVSTHRAAAIVSGAQVALISPALGGKKGRTQ